MPTFFFSLFFYFPRNFHYFLLFLPYVKLDKKSVPFQHPNACALLAMLDDLRGDHQGSLQEHTGIAVLPGTTQKDVDNCHLYQQKSLSGSPSSMRVELCLLKTCSVKQGLQATKTNRNSLPGKFFLPFYLPTSPRDVSSETGPTLCLMSKTSITLG